MDPKTRRFSFTRFANNAFPSFWYDTTGDPGHMSMPQKDMLYMYQATSASRTGNPQVNPASWDEGSIIASGILDPRDERLSAKAFRALQKSGVLDQESMVDTTKITKKFPHELNMIPAWRQRQIVDLLFWWEEETFRLRKLFDEQMELNGLLNSAREAGKVEEAEAYGALLRRVQGKMRTRPSQRDAETERDEDEVLRRGSAQLTALADGTIEAPEYGAPATRVASSGSIASLNGRRGIDEELGVDEELPGYSARDRLTR